MLKLIAKSCGKTNSKLNSMSGKLRDNTNTAKLRFGIHPTPKKNRPIDYKEVATIP